MDFSPESMYACQWAIDNLLSPGYCLDIVQCQEELATPIDFDVSAVEEYEDLKLSAARILAKKIEDLASSLEERKVCVFLFSPF